MNRVVSTVGGFAALSLTLACVSACGDSGGTGGAGGVGGSGSVTNVTSVTSVTHAASSTTNAATATHASSAQQATATSVTATGTTSGATTSTTTSGTTTSTTTSASTTASTTAATTSSTSASTTTSTGTGGGPPANWLCDPTYYGGSDGCDCGCGAVDPDCTDMTSASCVDCADTGSCSVADCLGGEHGSINATNNAICVPNTPETTAAACSDHVDNDFDGDIDCQDSDCAALPICTPPATWTCDPSDYNDGTCDCGCGALDPDCSDDLIATCQRCTASGSCSEFANDCPGFINPTDAKTCVASTPENTTAACSDHIDNDQDGDIDCQDSDCQALPICTPPATWTCNPNYFTDSTCDCGCGAIDPTCANSTLAACDYCADTGSCYTNADAHQCTGSTINPTNNAVCN